MQHTAAEHTLYYQLPQLGHVQRFNMSAYGRNFSTSISLTCTSLEVGFRTYADSGY